MERPGRRRRACLAVPRSVRVAGQDDQTRSQRRRPECVGTLGPSLSQQVLHPCPQLLSRQSSQRSSPGVSSAAGCGPRGGGPTHGLGPEPQRARQVPGWAPGKFAELRLAGPGVRRAGLGPPLPRCPSQARAPRLTETAPQLPILPLLPLLD